MGCPSIGKEVTSFSEAKIEDIESLKPLFRQEWEEVGEMKDILPLDINYPLLEKLMSVGSAVIYLALTDGKIVGHQCYTLGNHPKYMSSGLWAFGTSLYLSPEGRLPMVATRFLEYAEEDLRNRGVKFIQAGSRMGHHAATRVLEHVGFTPYEIGWLRPIL